MPSLTLLGCRKCNRYCGLTSCTMRYNWKLEKIITTNAINKPLVVYHRFPCSLTFYVSTYICRFLVLEMFTRELYFVQTFIFVFYVVLIFTTHCMFPHVSNKIFAHNFILILFDVYFNPLECALIKIHGCARGSHRPIDDLS